MDPAKMKVVDLKEKLSALGLDTRGVKAVLVERLKHALETGGDAWVDTSIADTTTDDVEESILGGGGDSPPRSARRPGPASRTRRRLSSSEPPATPTRTSSRRVVASGNSDSDSVKSQVIPEEKSSQESEASDSDSQSSSKPAEPKTPVKEASSAVSQPPGYLDTPRPVPRIEQTLPAKPAQQSPVKPAAEVSPAKPAVQQPSPTKPAVQQPSPAKPAVQQPSPEKPAVQQVSPVKPATQPSPVKPAAQPSPAKAVVQQTSPAKPAAPTQSPVQQQTPPKPASVQQQSPAKPAPTQQQSPAKPTAAQQSPVQPLPKPATLSPAKPVATQQSPTKPAVESPAKPAVPAVKEPSKPEQAAKMGEKTKEEISKSTEKHSAPSSEEEPPSKVRKVEQDGKGGGMEVDETPDDKDADISMGEARGDDRKEDSQRRRRRDKQSRWGNQPASESLLNMDQEGVDPSRDNEKEKKGSEQDDKEQNGRHRSRDRKDSDKGRDSRRSSSNNMRIRDIRELREPSPRRKSPVREPDLPEDKVTLSWYDSDLNLHIEVPQLNIAVPLTESAFAHCWAGARASHGVTKGKVAYEVRVENMQKSLENASPDIRVGWSISDKTLQLGEQELSWAFESSGRKIVNSVFEEYAKKIEEKDVIGVYLDLDATPCTISYTINGEEQGTAFEFEKDVLQEAALFPHVLSRNCCFIVNYGHNPYTLLTKTKDVQVAVEIPWEEYLKEKRAKKQKEKEAKEKEEEKRKRDDRGSRRDRNHDKRRRFDREDKKERDSEKDKEKSKEKVEKEEEGAKENGDLENNDASKGSEKYDPMDATDEDDSEVNKNEAEKAKKEAEEAAKKAEEEAAKKAAAKREEEEAAAKKEEAAAKKEEEEAAAKKAEEEAAAAAKKAEEEEEDEQPPEGKTTYTRYETKQEPDGDIVPILKEYIFIGNIPFEELVKGPARPTIEEQCHVIMMCGLPGSGKSHWAYDFASTHPQKRFNILGNTTFIERMKVDGNPFKQTYEGRWDILITKVTKCVVKLIELAYNRRRNYILDQTNVYPSAQRRKMREFTENYRRTAVVIVPDEETFAERQKLRQEKDGNDIPDAAVLEMKANFVLPEKCPWLDEIVFSELAEEEAAKIVDKYNKEGKQALGQNNARGFGGRNARAGGGGGGAGGRMHDQNRGRFGMDRGRPGQGGGPMRRDRRDDRRGGGWGGRGWDAPPRGDNWGRQDNRGSMDRSNRDGFSRGDRWGGAPGGGRGGSRDRTSMDRPPRGPPSVEGSRGSTAGRGGGGGSQGAQGQGYGRPPPSQNNRGSQQIQNRSNYNRQSNNQQGGSWNQQQNQTNQQGQWGQNWGQQSWGQNWGQQQAAWGNWNQWNNWNNQGQQGQWNKTGDQTQQQSQQQQQQQPISTTGQWGQWPQQQGYWATQQQWPAVQSQQGGGSSGKSGSTTTAAATTNATPQQNSSATHQQLWAQYAQVYAQQGYATSTAMNSGNAAAQQTEKK